MAHPGAQRLRHRGLSRCIPPCTCRETPEPNVYSINRALPPHSRALGRGRCLAVSPEGHPADMAFFQHLSQKGPFQAADLPVVQQLSALHTVVAVLYRVALGLCEKEAADLQTFGLSLRAIPKLPERHCFSPALASPRALSFISPLLPPRGFLSWPLLPLPATCSHVVEKMQRFTLFSHSPGRPILKYKQKTKYHD